MSETSAIEITGGAELPARREDIELYTADGLTLVGELALPLDRDPVATLQRRQRRFGKWIVFEQHVAAARFDRRLSVVYRCRARCRNRVSRFRACGCVHRGRARAHRRE